MIDTLPQKNLPAMSLEVGQRTENWYNSTSAGSRRPHWAAISAAKVIYTSLHGHYRLTPPHHQNI